MPFIKKNTIDFSIAENRIQILEQGNPQKASKPKKITGSRLSAILGLSEYNSPAKTWAIMTGIYQDEIDPFFTKPGIVIEPVIKDYVEKLLKVKFQSYEPAKIGWDVFKENSIFGGIPDGETLDNDGVILKSPNALILEIKTSSLDKFSYEKRGDVFKVKIDSSSLPVVKEPQGNLKKWFDGNTINVSKDYLYQLALYMYLRNTSRGIFAIAFLNPEDYSKPDNFDISKRVIKIIDFEVDLKSFQSVIEYATQWWNTYIVGKYSPLLVQSDYDDWAKM